MATITAPTPVEREFTVRSRSQLQLALRRFARNPLAMVGLASFLTMMVAAFAGPRLLPFGYDQQTDALSAPPGTDGHVFGTDTLGRDVLALTLRGVQWSMLMCAVFVVVACVLGVLVGALAGYYGGVVDDLLMRGVDITLTLPFLVVVLVLAAAFPSARTPVGVALLIAVSSWMALARIVRAQLLSRATVRRPAAARQARCRRRSIAGRSLRMGQGGPAGDA